MSTDTTEQTLQAGSGQKPDADSPAASPPPPPPRLDPNLRVVEDPTLSLADQFSLIQSFTWQWLQQRATDADFEELLRQAFFDGRSHDLPSGVQVISFSLLYLAIYGSSLF